jgi:tetratricopeptide (TPR) repeat protein
MKNRNSMHNCSSKLKNHTMLSFQLHLYIICLTILPFNLLTSLTGIACAKSAAEVSYKLPKNSFSFLKDPNNSNARQLWRANTSIAKGQDNQQSKDKLKRAIEQLRSVSLSPQKNIPEPVAPEVPESPKPKESPSRTTESEKSDKEDIKETEFELSDGMITDRTRQILKNLSERSDELENPFELGEVLFLSGNLAEAAVFYQEALNRISAEDISSVQERAWILFQIGNCLRHDDMSTAAKMYGQLITQYPNSPWTEMAEAQAKLIDWQQKDEPHKLIAEREP